MTQTLIDLFSSKKFLASLIAAIAYGLGHWGIHVDTDKMMELISPIVIYILSQGIADHGKEAAIINSASTAATVQATGAAPGSPSAANVVNVTTPAATLAILLFGGLMISQASCGSNLPHNAGMAAYDCTKADSPKLEALLLGWATGSQPLNWDTVLADAETAGVEIGGCALTELVQGNGHGFSSPPAGAKYALDKFKSKHGSPTFHTAKGDL